MLKPIMKELPSYDTTFRDVPRQHLFYDVIEEMVAIGYIGGYPDQTFRPQQPIIREHVALMLARKHTFNEILQEVSFNDVPNNAFNYEAIMHLAKANILTGYYGYFQPEKPITRAEVATILLKAFGIKMESEQVAFIDVKQGDWYYDAVQTLASHQYVTGYNGLFRPQDPITRGEFVAILARVLQH